MSAPAPGEPGNPPGWAALGPGLKYSTGSPVTRLVLYTFEPFARTDYMACMCQILLLLS